MTERRHYTRILFEAPAELRQKNGVWDTRILDLSLNGALVERPEDYSPCGLSVFLSFYLPDSQIEIDIEMQLKHMDEETVGFKCLHIDVESISHLRRMLTLNKGDASLLDRELDHFVAERAGSRY
ncbi:PilZ domain-containing protein [Shewanella submarina]|uniref:Cyclic diguanosine monophosphate-binding protein n=1 Tax=Shewanella submarina TaxID=2016376 RepID=A0ABV7G9M0_9GAMM|nr:PilZ domain-containing protein [Shewanella submarina]MCL1037196.1 PilZ domain-containing protein [Shewanella submarina]